MNDVRIPMVYIAGPISIGDYLENIGKGIDFGELVAEMGLVPFIPHLDLLWILRHPKSKSWSERLNYDEQVILRCDAVIRIPGESRGAEREELFAREHDIPVFRNLQELARWAKRKLHETKNNRRARRA